MGLRLILAQEKVSCFTDQSITSHFPGLFVSCLFYPLKKEMRTLNISALLFCGVSVTCSYAYVPCISVMSLVSVLSEH